MKIFSWNVNGIRAIYKKNFVDWLKKSNADIVCLQETKAEPEQLENELIKPQNYFSYFNSAIKKGYAGVAVYTKEKPLRVEHKIRFKRFDEEGRSLKLDYPDFTLVNLYLPHGGRQKENLGYKLEVYDYLIKILEKIKNENVILIGDFNIAHTEIDLERPKQNKNNIMFTPEEREKLDKIVELGFVDTFRQFNKEKGHYTWWPYFANARERNLGWRIDYCFVSRKLVHKLKDAFILSDVEGSDHCPIGVEIEF
jgi:exodeoxyribonuclease-3